MLWFKGSPGLCSYEYWKITVLRHDIYSQTQPNPIGQITEYTINKLHCVGKQTLSTLYKYVWWAPLIQTLDIGRLRELCTKCFQNHEDPKAKSPIHIYFLQSNKNHVVLSAISRNFFLSRFEIDELVGI